MPGGMKMDKGILIVFGIGLLVLGILLGLSIYDEIRCEEVFSKLSCSELKNRIDIDYHFIDGCFLGQEELIKENYLDRCLEQ